MGLLSASFVVCLCIVAVLAAYRDGSEHPKVQQLLKQYKRHHKSWKFETHARPPLPVLDAQGKPVTFPSDHHKAPRNASYPKNLLWLLKSFSSGAGIPFSYSDILPTEPPTSYWATETYNKIGAIDPYGNSVKPDSAIALQERTLTRWALNLYDGATWEIALSLWNLWEVAWAYERNILYTSTTGAMGKDNGAPGGLIDIRGDHSNFKYGDAKISGDALLKITCPGNVTRFNQNPDGSPSKDPVKQVVGAFYYRMVGPKYQLIDPFEGNYANSFKIPWPNNDTTTPWNVYGMVHFNDWKPITGENVWSAIIGPLQSLYLATDGNLTDTTCGSPDHSPPQPCDWKTFDTTPPQVQQAITILPALKALLSGLGAIYHCPWGSQIFPYDPAEGTNVSNENNFSAYAALKMLQSVLLEYTTGSSDPTLQYARETVDALLKGLENWFDNYLLSSKDVLPDGSQVVPQGGHIIDNKFMSRPINEYGGFAVDCQTWGLTVLGAPRVDARYGKRMAYNIWQAARKWAGYWKDTPNGRVLAGVGYTHTVSSNFTVDPQHNIWSAEWTFGAINMAQVLSQQYSEMGDTEAADSLMADANSMYNEVTKLWNPDDKVEGGLMFPDGSYVYANARFFIPWGWYANPISALCSTAWSIMMEQNFNPFELGGGKKPPLTPPSHLNDLYYSFQE